MDENQVVAKQSTFEGWAIVEMMGHRREIGFVTSEAFGSVVLFRVEVPALPEREDVAQYSQYYRRRSDGCEIYVPAHARVKLEAVPSRTCFVAPGSLYALNPCTERAAIAALEQSISREITPLDLPGSVLLSAGDSV